MSPSRVEAPLSYEYPNETKEQLEYAELEALDISKLDQPGGKQALAEQVLKFINKNGFFYVVGHGFSDEQVRRQYALCEAFFQLPLEEKLRYACDTAKGDFRGYKPQSSGKLAGRDNDERYNIPKFTAEHERPHPQLIRDHWDEIRAFSLKIHNDVLLPLLRLFAYVLEIDDEEYLAKRHRYEAEGLEYLRYMKYHPRTAEADARVGNIWAKGHTDYNTLTLLFHQPVAGLQVQTPEGRWRHVRSPRDAIIVNIADALEFLSGGYLKSTVHRVVRPPEDQTGAPRLSLIYFARPEANILLKPVASPLLRRMGLQSEMEPFAHDVTAEEWARARIAKDHRFRTGLVDQREKEIIAGVNQKYYD
ncbi:putative 1-aminocyclopropane-1-carboxylate oxidase [Annulohypoxylon truncatum]|uniref:putative 1-aminocyclopropane-1-carboxylate oxidase n=1 Tax=Annulohypoxylon truncatum TaxID=327061 RepID=UPI0020086225|nr:putative 1-aminocyclopropane-1-carboxylate oxidase [Annulohypoxylon truncatum]KAI1205558.1 putative 1-aminocyclopropane-1-carboxylate oxidase [Annulohypoxylon truncatum]